MAVMACGVGSAPDGDVVLATFDDATYGAWTATGEAFGDEPASGTLPNQMEVRGFAGRGLANSFRGGDGAVGKLVSPEFDISRKAIAFLIGGGGWAGKTCMNLVVDGKVVRTATGTNTQDGGSEALDAMHWNVDEFLGKKGRLEIVDEATGGWGHINVDQIVLTDTPPPGMVELPIKTTRIEKTYLNLPVRNDATLRRLKIAHDGRVVQDFEVALTEKEPDYWVFVDVSRWKGEQIEVRAERLPAGGAALDKVEQSDALKGSEPLYAERLRPQFHFTSRRGWLNDPNGMVYSNGEYHLYYQHNPFGWTGRNMHWGHAVSRDMLRWTELPTALAPHSFGDWVWSGSAVADAKNTAGWKKGDRDVIVAAYTSTARGECVVYSNDGGRTFTEFEGNPVVTHTKGEGRDPRLLWYERSGGAGGHWVMAVYDEDRSAAQAERWGIAFHTSPDLKKWTYRSRIGGFFECPDIFQLPVDGGKGGSKWVLTAADSAYLIGDFDGETFTPDAPARKLPGNRTNAFYAAQTFTGMPDGRCVQIGWGRITLPGMPFNQMMSFPCELTLRSTPEGIRMFTWPIAEVATLHGASASVRDRKLAPGEHLASERRGELLDVSLVADADAASVVELSVRGVAIRVDAAKGRVECGAWAAPVQLAEKKVKLRVLVDRASLEIFANDGEVAMLIAPEFKGDVVQVRADGGAIVVKEFVVHDMKSVWPKGASGK